MINELTIDKIECIIGLVFQLEFERFEEKNKIELVIKEIIQLEDKLVSQFPYKMFYKKASCTAFIEVDNKMEFILICFALKRLGEEILKLKAGERGDIISSEIIQELHSLKEDQIDLINLFS